MNEILMTELVDTLRHLEPELTSKGTIYFKISANVTDTISAPKITSHTIAYITPMNKLEFQ